jgi:hypothetical protein
LTFSLYVRAASLRLSLSLMALIHQQIWVIVALILLVIAIFLFGVPLTARLRKLLGGKRHDPSSSPRTVVSSHHNPFQRGSSSRMSPRRQDSQETLLDELVDIGDDKLDGILSLFIFRPPAVAYSSAYPPPINSCST